MRHARQFRHLAEEGHLATTWMKKCHLAEEGHLAAPCDRTGPERGSPHQAWPVP